ncbi:MAG: VTT domain-containing protein [Candidatus Eremiobacteraeota bacterium]|nr:VTT domain-containing protein [Candidatus Eremiobacteraeota bacterium]MCW5868309.1 VTT domain-containing protein [Candidatus Eremiobacteraeota bacterium]
MDLSALLTHYGLPVLFVGTAICCFGVPMPGLSLALVAAGSFARRAQWSLAGVLFGVVAAAVSGDLLAFWLARLAGRQRILDWADRLSLRHALDKAVRYQARVQGPSIFLTRWLVPLGPWVNFNCGMADYASHKFLTWSLLGQSFWVLLYVIPGYFFQDRVQQLLEVMGALGWASLAVLLLATLSWRVYQLRSS